MKIKIVLPAIKTIIITIITKITTNDNKNNNKQKTFLEIKRLY